MRLYEKENLFRLHVIATAAQLDIPEIWFLKRLINVLQSFTVTHCVVLSDLVGSLDKKAIDPTIIRLYYSEITGQ